MADCDSCWSRASEAVRAVNTETRWRAWGNQRSQHGLFVGGAHEILRRSWAEQGNVKIHRGGWLFWNVVGAEGPCLGRAGWKQWHLLFSPCTHPESQIMSLAVTWGWDVTLGQTSPKAGCWLLFILNKGKSPKFQVLCELQSYSMQTFICPFYFAFVSF